MRILIVLVLLIPSLARAQSAPSTVLERAIKLYDREDYLSATIELHKVLAGETGDDAANLQRAEFFMGKADYQLGLYAASLTVFERLADDPSHTYHAAALKWILAIARVLPESSGILSVIDRYEPGDEAIQQLGELADEYTVLRATSLLYQGQLDDALSNAHLVRDDAPMAAAAHHVIGEAMFRVTDVEKGIEAEQIAARDPAIAPLAVHALALWPRLLGDPGAAAEALAAIAKAGGPAAPYAAYAASRIAHDLPALRGLTDTFDALAFVATCGQPPIDDLAAAMKARAPSVTAALNELVAPEDNADLFTAADHRLHDDDADAHVIRLALSDALPLRWVEELARERALFEGFDRAWLSTAIAADIEADFELQLSLARANAGQWMRDRFALIREDLGRVSGAGSGGGVEVSAALCKLAGLPAPAGGVAQTPVVVPPQHHGCAGCAATDPAPGLLLFAIMAASSRARRRRPR